MKINHFFNAFKYAMIKITKRKCGKLRQLKKVLGGLRRKDPRLFRFSQTKRAQRRWRWNFLCHFIAEPEMDGNQIFKISILLVSKYFLSVASFHFELKLFGWSSDRPSEDLFRYLFYLHLLCGTQWTAQGISSDLSCSAGLFLFSSFRSYHSCAVRFLKNPLLSVNLGFNSSSWFFTFFFNFFCTRTAKWMSLFMSIFLKFV